MLCWAMLRWLRVRLDDAYRTRGQFLRQSRWSWVYAYETTTYDTHTQISYRIVTATPRKSPSCIRLVPGIVSFDAHYPFCFAAMDFVLGGKCKCDPSTHASITSSFVSRCKRCIWNVFQNFLFCCVLGHLKGITMYPMIAVSFANSHWSAAIVHTNVFHVISIQRECILLRNSYYMIYGFSTEKRSKEWSWREKRKQKKK